MITALHFPQPLRSAAGSHRSFLVFLGAIAMASGCVYQECPVSDARAHRGAAFVVVDSPPPPLRAEVEVRPDKPEADAVWVPGHWDWRGRWVWVDGRWDRARPGYAWTPPVARRDRSGRVQYHPGHFRPQDSAPPPVYRQPGEVEVSVPPERPERRAAPAGQARAQAPRARREGPVVARPGGPAQQPGAAETRRPDPPEGTRPEVEGGSSARVGGGVRVQPGAVQPGPSEQAPRSAVPPPPGAAQSRPGAGIERPPRGGQAEAVALTCRLTTARAPAGGYVTLEGRGWGSSPVVRVGGNIAAVATQEDARIRFQVPRDSAGGAVEITDGDRSAACGHLAVIGR